MKKANALLDATIIGAVIFILVMVVMNMNKVTNSFNDMIQSNDDFSSESKTLMQNSTYNMSMWDTILVVLLTFMWMASIAMARNIGSHPVFFVFFCIGIAFVLIAMMSLEDVYEDMVADNDYSSFETTYPKCAWIMSHFVIVIMIIGFSIAVVLYRGT